MSICFNPACASHNPDTELLCQQCGEPLLLADRYKALREIGSGGFGKTYLGIDVSQPNKPPCAIKQFLPAATNDRNTSSRLFKKEAESLRSLSHPQIPKFLDYFQWQEQQYIVQEYIAGQTLERELAESGVFSETKIRELLRQILPILEYLHSRKLIHRDIKPSNIIRSSSVGEALRMQHRRLVLVDFGTTKVATGTALARTGTSIGTAEFVAPEQVRGKAVFASDLYSLGVTCIHLLANASPFDMVDGDNNWVWPDWTIDNPVSDGLAIVLDRLIEAPLSKRYTSAREALAALDAPIRAPKNSLVWWLSGGAIGALLLGIWLSSRLAPADGPIARKTKLDVVEALFTYTKIQNDNYLEKGEFLDEPSQLIPIHSHYFIAQPIQNGIQIAAVPRQSDTYGYVAVLWGGKMYPEDRERLANWQPEDPTDIGTFSMPNFRRTPSDYSTRVFYCESFEAVAEPPPLSPGSKSLPISSKELACPTGYAFSLGIIEAMGKLSAKTSPTIVVPNN
ncbi:MAG: serine/threonine-protein kinase [Cyanobacteriota bacterium]|nr:serine/threonine-protein kinase [Cyanobacteriota bacterium]